MIFWASLWLATACNLALWQSLWRLPEIQGWRGLLVGVGMAVLVGACLHLLLTLLAGRWTVKPLITLLLLMAAVGSHFMLSYGVVIDTSMIINTLQTDPREARDLMNWRLLAMVAGLGVAPAWWLWRQPLAYPKLPRQLLINGASALLSVLLLGGTLLLMFQDFSSLMRNHTQLRYLLNPLNSIYGLAEAGTLPWRQAQEPFKLLGEDARLGPSYQGQGKPPLVLLVLGETARSGNFGINGYGRDTTPELAQLGVVSQRNAWSCGTSTAASEPCMFSHLGREGFNKAKGRQEGLLDVLQRAGLAVLWLDNQSGCKGVCDRVSQVSTTALKVPGLCDGGECLDEVMLHELEQRIAALPAAQRRQGVVLVMHQMGSHGPAYFKRSPAAFKRFTPECRSNNLPECDRPSVINAYDNSIAYTDHFLAKAIAWLRGQDSQASTALVYVSDHGESLGENNLYLHGLPYAVAPDVQKKVPWISWLSPAFEKRLSLPSACLRQQLERPLSHDHYFHSVLGLLDVQTSVYRRELDLYADCRAPGSS